MAANSQVESSRQLAEPEDFKSVDNYVPGIHSDGIDRRHLATFQENNADRDTLNRAIYIARHWTKLPPHVRETICTLVDQFMQ